MPKRSLPEGLCYAMVHKQHEHGRVVAVDQKQVFGSAEALEAALGQSSTSQTVNIILGPVRSGTNGRQLGTGINC